MTDGDVYAWTKEESDKIDELERIISEGENERYKKRKKQIKKMKRMDTEKIKKILKRREKDKMPLISTEELIGELERRSKMECEE